MKLELRHCLILIVIMALCLVAGAKLNASRQSWEYKIITTSSQHADQEKALSQHGAEGWEVVMKEGEYTYLLKRAK
jgi:hypothetical protein